MSVARHMPQASSLRHITHTVVARLFLREVWAIGVVAAPIEAVLKEDRLPAPRWLAPPRAGRFHADPFPVLVNGQAHLLFEMWSLLKGRGWISTIRLDATEITDPENGVRAIDIGCHASFPATFRYNGQLYCAPEMWESGGLCIFQMGSTPLCWTFVNGSWTTYRLSIR